MYLSCQLCVDMNGNNVLSCKVRRLGGKKFWLQSPIAKQDPPSPPNDPAFTCVPAPSVQNGLYHEATLDFLDQYIPQNNWHPDWFDQKKQVKLLMTVDLGNGQTTTEELPVTLCCKRDAPALAHAKELIAAAGVLAAGAALAAVVYLTR